MEQKIYKTNNHNKKTAERYLERLRSMSGEERMKCAFELCNLMWKVVENSICNEFPGISESELKEKMKQRLRR